jgi:hypothetical protein
MTSSGYSRQLFSNFDSIRPLIHNRIFSVFGLRHAGHGGAQSGQCLLDGDDVASSNNILIDSVGLYPSRPMSFDTLCRSFTSETHAGCAVFNGRSSYESCCDHAGHVASSRHFDDTTIDFFPIPAVSIPVMCARSSPCKSKHQPNHHRPGLTHTHHVLHERGGTTVFHDISAIDSI